LILLFIFVICYDPNQENGCLENYICFQTFGHNPVPIRPSGLHSLHALPVEFLAIPVNSCAWVNHAERKTHIRLSFSCVLSNAHTYALTQMPRCV